MGLIRRSLILISLISYVVVSYADDDVDVKKVAVLLNEEDARAARKSTFDTLGISMDDLLLEERKHVVEGVSVPRTVEPLSPGDEYTAEALSKSLESVELYEKALSFMQRGKGHGTEGRKAAYRLLDQAAEMGNKDAMKLMAFSHMFGDRTRWSPDTALKYFMELAHDGSADAQLGLAFMHSTGFGLSTNNQAKSIVYYTFSALGGNPLAQMALGYRYLYGIGVPMDCERSLQYYKQVADKVAGKIKFSTGVSSQRIRLTDENEPTTASQPLTMMDQNLLDYYRFIAEKGDTAALSGLGQLYLAGSRGVEQNFELALRYFTTAAESGHAVAFANLGKMYLDGTPVTPQNNVTAFTYFLQAANKGNLIGYTGLGIMYLKGMGVKQDYGKAARLFTLAAEQGGGEGQLYMGDMYFKGMGVKREFKTAIKYYQMASQNSQVLAFYNLATMHATGTGVSRSCPIAVDLYKNVAERGRWTDKMMEAYTAYRDGRTDEAAVKYLFLADLGYEPAQTNFAYLMDRGEANAVFHMTRNDVLGVALVNWQRSANQEHAMARIKVGDYHYYGYGTDVDLKTAAQQYKMAAERHLASQAMFNLGYMHEHGEGIARDLHLAKRYYDMAAEHNADAALPCTLALMKLQAVFVIDTLNQMPIINFLDKTFGVSWDLLLLTCIPIAVSILLVRFMQRRNEAHDNDF